MKIVLLKDVPKLGRRYDTKDVLDYGCGKGGLAKLLDFPIKEYDPAIPEKSAPPDFADIVICASVLEHVEPECLDDVVQDLRRCMRRAGLIIVPHNPAIDFLPDGRNAHRTIESLEWWREKLGNWFVLQSAVRYGSLTSNEPGKVMIGSRTYFIVT